VRFNLVDRQVSDSVEWSRGASCSSTSRKARVPSEATVRHAMLRGDPRHAPATLPCLRRREMLPRNQLQ